MLIPFEKGHPYYPKKPYHDVITLTSLARFLGIDREVVKNRSKKLKMYLRFRQNTRTPLTDYQVKRLMKDFLIHPVRKQNR